MLSATPTAGMLCSKQGVLAMAHATLPFCISSLPLVSSCPHCRIIGLSLQFLVYFFQLLSSLFILCPSICSSACQYLSLLLKHTLMLFEKEGQIRLKTIVVCDIDMACQYLSLFLKHTLMFGPWFSVRTLSTRAGRTRVPRIFAHELCQQHQRIGSVRKRLKTTNRFKA
jgi:hypothetical protein